MAPKNDLQSKARAAMNAKKAKKDPMMQYYLWVGGTCATIVAAVLVLVVNPTKGDFQTWVNDPGLVSVINRNAKTWGAGSTPFFEGWTLGDAKLLEGTSVSGRGVGGSITPCQDTKSGNIPDQFDARLKWPQCFQSPIFNMGNCTSSWAIASASALSNRFCIGNPETYGELMLSPQQLLSCDTQNRGCSGGDLDSAWDYIQKEGLVSENCFPYQAADADEVKCTQKCTNETPLKIGGVCLANNEEAIKREIMTSGPVTAPLFLTDDFLVYRGGLYQELPTTKQLTNGQRQRIIHGVKIVGWGPVSRGKMYWIIENWWGEEWGEGGFAKVQMSGAADKRDGLILEAYAFAGTPKAGVFDEEDADFDPDLDLADVDDAGDE